MPSYQNLTKPTRDTSAYHRSQSLNKQPVPSHSNSRILLQRKIIELEKELEECDFQRQANIVYNRQFREIARLLGDDNMEFDDIRSKIQDMILEGPLQNHNNGKAPFSHSNISVQEKSVNLLREEIAQLKYELSAERNMKQAVKQKVQRCERNEHELRRQNSQLQHKLQIMRKQMQQMRNVNNNKFSNQNNMQPGTQQRDPFQLFNRSRQTITYNGTQVSSVNWISKIREKDDLIEEKNQKIKELETELERNQYEMGQRQSEESQFSRKYKQIERKYENYSREYQKLEERLKEYEWKISQNQQAMQRYQEMEGQYELLDRNFNSMQHQLEQSRHELEQSRRYQEENEQLRQQLTEYEMKINRLESQIREMQTKLSNTGLVQRLEQKISQLQEEIRLKTEQVGSQREKTKQEQNEIIKLGEYIQTLNADIHQYQFKLARTSQFQLTAKLHQRTIQQYSQELVQAKTTIALLNRQIQQSNSGQNTIAQLQLQIHDKTQRISSLEQQLLAKTQQLSLASTKHTQLKVEYDQLVQTCESKSTQLLELTRKYQMTLSKNQQLESERQKLLQQSSSTYQQFNLSPQIKKIQTNPNLNLMSHQQDSTLNNNQQQNSRISMQRIENVISNVNPNTITESQSIKKTGQFTVNNTLENAGHSLRQEYKFQMQNHPLNNIDQVTSNIQQQNSKENVFTVERSQVEYKLVNFNNPNYAKQASSLSRQDNLSHLMISLNPLQNHNIFNQTSNLPFTNQLQNVQNRTYKQQNVQQLVSKISLLEQELARVKQTSESKSVQIEILHKKIEQLEVQLLQLTRKIELYQHSSSRQQAKEYSGNFGNSQHQNIVGVEAQAISQLTKKSCVEEELRKSMQGEMSGSSFKYYEKKSQESNNQINGENSIYNKTHSVEGKTINQGNQQQKQIKKQVQLKQYGEHEKDGNNQNSQLSEQNSLSKLVMGNTNSPNNITPHPNELTPKQSQSKIQPKSQHNDEQNKKQRQSQRSIHERIQDVSVDKSVDKESVNSSEHNHLRADSNRNGYELPQYSRKNNKQTQISSNKIITNKAVQITTKNSKQQHIRPQSSKSSSKQSSQLQVNKGNQQHEQVNNNKKQPSSHVNQIKPLSVIVSNSNLESAIGSRPNSMIREKREESGSRISQERKASPSPGRISITYGRESKIIYRSGSRERENSISFQEQQNNKRTVTNNVYSSHNISSTDRRATLPIVSSKQIIEQRVPVSYNTNGQTLVKHIIHPQPQPQQVSRHSSIIQHNQQQSHIVFNNNLKSSRVIVDSNSTIRPVSRSNSRDTTIHTRFKSPNTRLSKQQIQIQTLINDQYAPTNNFSHRLMTQPNVPPNHHPQTSPTSDYFASRARQQQMYEKQQNMSPRNSQVKNSLLSGNLKNSAISQNHKSEVCCAISPEHYQHQNKKGSLSNSQISKFNVVKQSRNLNQGMGQQQNGVNEFRSSFADRIHYKQTNAASLGQSMASKEPEQPQDVNNISIADSQDSGINVVQYKSDGFNCCRG